MKPIIEVKNISKKYRYGQAQPYYALRDVITNAIKAPFRTNKKDEFWALKDISFSIKKGEVLGVIGPNGSGKSTLLKILSRITFPSVGSAVLRGRVGSLLEVGTGFHPELTGRENIFLNGAILGMKRQEIKRKFNEIVEFSGVEKFLDTPVKRFSSGMYVRLAFAVAANLDPEILLIDEVLAVGDAEFQKKCLGKMGSMSKDQEKTVIFVSHNMAAINELCDKTLYLDRGRQVMIGKTGDTVAKYLGIHKNNHLKSNYCEKEKDLPIQIVSVKIQNKEGKESADFTLFEDINVQVEYVVKKKLTGSVINMMIKRNGVGLLLSFDTDMDQNLLDERRDGRYISNIMIPRKLLKPGTYNLDFRSGFSRRETVQLLENIVGFEVKSNLDSVHYSYDENREGLLAFPLKWQTQRK